MKIYIDGVDNIGWAIDSNRSNLQKALRRLMLDETRSVISADIVHNLWWDNLFGGKLLKNLLGKIAFRRRNLIVSAVNFVDFSEQATRNFDEKVFNKVKSMAWLWLAPSSKQLEIFRKASVNSELFPLLVDTKLFRPVRHELTKQEIAGKHKIPYELIKDKVVISSFQRDSLGADLTKPKWQKGPDILLELLKILPRDKFILLLASPRRHYLLNECRKHCIPFYYLGAEMNRDDVTLNNLDHAVIADLYNLSDIYLITSRSEGGPTAVIETTATKTFVFSTDVGCAPDYIMKENIFDNIENYKAALIDHVLNYKQKQARMNAVVEKQFSKCMELSSDDAVDAKLKYVYSKVLSSNEKH